MELRLPSIGFQILYGCIDILMVSIHLLVIYV